MSNVVVALTAELCAVVIAPALVVSRTPLVDEAVLSHAPTVPGVNGFAVVVKYSLVAMANQFFLCPYLSLYPNAKSTE